MKKQIIATLMGAVILFIWQFLSWSIINLHSAEQQYTSDQDEILALLSEKLESGGYFLPNAPAGSSQEVEQAVMDNSQGKPWATINYHESMTMNMGSNMARGLLVDLIAVFLLVWLLLRFEHLDIKNAVMASLAIGLIGFFTIPYLNSIWFETPTVGHIIDAIVPWALVGAVVGWWLTRE